MESLCGRGALGLCMAETQTTSYLSQDSPHDNSKCHIIELFRHHMSVHRDTEKSSFCTAQCFAFSIMSSTQTDEHPRPCCLFPSSALFLFMELPDCWSQTSSHHPQESIKIHLYNQPFSR